MTCEEGSKLEQFFSFFRGKAILIQSVAQVIPLHHMYCYKLPKEFHHELNMILARFWWGGNEEKKKIRWRNCDALCTSKLDGLGFKDFEAFNLALLASQWWRVINNPNNLACKVLCAKYFPTSEASSSFLWRRLLAGREVVQKGSIWRVGDGSNIEVFNDWWVKALPDSKVPPPADPTLQSITVSSLMEVGEQRWDVDILCDLFDIPTCDAILKIPLSRACTTDKKVWCDSPNGTFSVCSAYATARLILGKPCTEKASQREVWQLLWSSKVSPC